MSSQEFSSLYQALDDISKIAQKIQHRPMDTCRDDGRIADLVSTARSEVRQLHWDGVMEDARRVFSPQRLFNLKLSGFGFYREGAPSRRPPRLFSSGITTERLRGYRY